jgi:type VI secretion system protein ImpL
MRWGLYTGEKLYPLARRLYWRQFSIALLNPVRRDMAAYLESRPPTAGKVEEFAPAYETLKAYLEIGSEPKHATRDFLPPVLSKWWQRAQPQDEERRKLASAQFEYFADELRVEPPYPVVPPDAAVAASRTHLQSYGGSEVAYQLMLNAASLQAPAVKFRERYPQAGDIVLNKFEPEAAFTKGGWAKMQALVKSGPFNAEEWVVRLSATGQDRGPEPILARYQREYCQKWADFLQGLQVVACPARAKTPGEAAKRLAVLSAPGSPLLGALCMVSENTDVDSAEVKETFQPVRAVVMPDCQKQLSVDSNKAYLDSLFGLKESLAQALPPGGEIRSVVDPHLSAVRTAAHQMATQFHNDNEFSVGHHVTRLLTEPAASTEACLAGAGDAAPLCTAANGVLSRYPFSNQRGAREAAPADIDQFLHPNSGLLWQFFQQRLNGAVIRRGSDYVPNPLAPQAAREEFLRFFNGASHWTQVLYRSGDRLEWKVPLRVNPSPGVEKVTIDVGGQQLVFLTSRPETREFTWIPGQKLTMTVILMGGIAAPPWSSAGTWSLLRFFDDMQRVRDQEPELALSFPIRERESNRPFEDRNGNAIKVNFAVGGDVARLLHARIQIPNAPCTVHALH